MVPVLDYERLKRSLEYFVEHYACSEPVQRDEPLIQPFNSGESSQTIRTHRALEIAIADFVEGTQDFCHERLSEIDRDLQKRDAYTLSFLRNYFGKSGDPT